jgi:hypothetical protein
MLHATSFDWDERTIRRVGVFPPFDGTYRETDKTCLEASQWEYSRYRKRI